MRKLALKALLLALLTTRAMADYSNTVMSLSPLAYWKLDETNLPPVDTATNSGTLGTSANGYYVSYATHPTPGALANGTGTAAYFPGTNGNRVVVPYQPVLGAAAPFSVEFWANSASVSATMCIASLTQFGNPPGAGDGTRKGWLFYQNSASGWTFRTYGSANTAFAATANQTVTAGQWYHVVGVYDGTNNTLYVNGQVAATIAAPSYVPVDANASPFSVGSRGYGALGFFSFDGSVDEVAYYTNILSAADVLAHYQNGTSTSPATPYSQLVAAKAPPVYLHFNEPAFTAANPGTYPVAVNLGSDGADINGAYEPGTTPGTPGVPFVGFGTNNFATTFGPEQGGYINVGNSEALDFTGPFSVVLWFKTGPTDARFQSFIGRGDNSWRGGVDGNTGLPHFALGSNPDVVGTENVNDGKWHQFAGVYDGQNLYLYIDGILNSTRNSVTSVSGSTNTVTIGTVPDYLEDRVFKGSVDEVAVFNSALTSDQIAQVYFAADAPPSIAQQPISPVTLYQGITATIPVTAFGVGPLSYQWQFNGAYLPTQTSSTLVLPAIQNNEAGNYALVVTNAYGAITSSVVSLNLVSAPTNTYSAAVLADSPIAYWRLGETAGTTAYDYVGGHNGSYTNVVLGQPGYSAYDTNPAAEFGSTTNTPSLVGSIPGIDFSTNTGTTSFSLECWLKAWPQSSDSCIMTKGTGGGGEQFDLDFGAGNSKIRYLYRDASGNAILANSSFVPDGQWHHVVVVTDDVNEQVYLYIDGALTTAANTTENGIQTSGQPMTIGCRQSGTTAFDDQLNGTVDEVAIYGTALTPDQVLNHYNARYPSAPPIITTQPASTTNYISASSTFEVEAAGNGLSYQWLSNNVPLSGQSLSNLTVGPLVLADAANYQVEVQNSYGSVTSSIAKVTLLAAPTTLDLSSGLVLHLTFDNSLADTSGRNNNGTNVGATSFVSDGRFGSALHYYTDTSVPTYNYVTLGYCPDLSFSSNVNFSVSYWVRRNHRRPSLHLHCHQLHL
jgi:hypothetical protein